MIIKFINAVLIASVLVFASMLYSLEQNKRGLARSIVHTDTEIAEAKENIKLHKAEWSSLIRPDRLKLLAAQHTTLQPVKVTQFVTLEQLATRLPAQPFTKLETQGEDAIGDVLKGLAQ